MDALEVSLRESPTMTVKNLAALWFDGGNAIRKWRCPTCGVARGELCKQVFNKPIGAPMRTHVHEDRLLEPLVAAMKRAAREP